MADFAAAGGCVVDPEVVRQLLARQRDPLARLTPREREVLGLMAEGIGNAAIARVLVVSDAAVAKHINAMLPSIRPATTTGGSGPSWPTCAARRTGGRRTADHS